MSGRRAGYKGDDVVAENKIPVVWTVEKKIKLVFRMVCCDSFEVLIAEPPDAFESSMQQQSGIDSDLQINFVLMRLLFGHLQ